MATATHQFPPLHIVPPKAGHAHTHTAIMLHGRSSDGEEFAEELFSMKLSDQEGDDLHSLFPSWRWVFPSSQSIWSSVFQEDITQWFDIHSLTDVDAKQELQMEGIRQSTKYVLALMEEEVQRLHNAREKLFVCGISMGGAIGLWTLLCQKAIGHNIGGFVGLSCWLPFTEVIKRHLWTVKDSLNSPGASPDEVEARSFIAKIMDSKAASAGLLSSTPVFLGHGVDDAYVDISLGRKVKEALKSIGFTPEWREYAGAEQEGHWIKEPEELADIAAFLITQAEKSAL
ncbi:hypothetical protein EPUS_02068 [Endocarpon pusillum Z07020]|uniref:Phospholipase/carboxylesterase/thioesterase domain-containing protein n=1 Tax=Endocarpon pusillum (strain Z07020 / HMAS-L-300199) TaxID=1263415 RepID=U1GQX7_ENDPU|nr:uncharacterized protein EPUS_02068 [Endocarpon pusillum Z07020]ERF74381.1 hypothetical protein EPUS_02068 [Endocarpon pusillum Z07020]